MIEYGIHCFLAVAQEKSFTRAAKRVKRTQSAVTQQIKKLEATLGKKLFYRNAHLSLTSDGEVFFAYAKKMYTLYRELLDHFIQPEPEGKVSFGVPEDFATLFLSDMLFNFSKMHPRIPVSVECGLTVHLLNQFNLGNLDMAMIKMSTPKQLSNGVKIWSEPLQWVGTKELTQKHLKKDCPLPLVLFPSPCVYRQQALKLLKKANMSWEIVFSSSSHVGAMAAVQAGMGITVLPEMLVPENLEKIKEPLLPCLPQIHVFLLKKREDDPSIQTLESFLLNKLKHKRSFV